MENKSQFKNIILVIDNNGVGLTSGVRLTIDPINVRGGNFFSFNEESLELLQRVFKPELYGYPQEPAIILTNGIKGNGIRRLENSTLGHYKIPLDRLEEYFIEAKELELVEQVGQVEHSKQSILFRPFKTFMNTRKEIRNAI